MTYLALVLAAGYPLTILAFLTYCRTLTRPYQRREEAWADRVMLMAGTPWRTPTVQVEEVPELEPYTFAPEGEPDLSFTP